MFRYLLSYAVSVLQCFHIYVYIFYISEISLLAFSHFFYHMRFFYSLIYYGSDQFDPIVPAIVLVHGSQWI